MSQIYESFSDKSENENRNLTNHMDTQSRNVLMRNKCLPEKLEKYLNDEKERELESLYEENRQLLLEIAKLRKTNQMLVKDVSKKNEIIDDLDSNLVEVEEKLENIKKKNMNMYNEILSRERVNNSTGNMNIKNMEGNIDSEYFIKASNIGKYNTVDIKKSDLCKVNNNRPNSTNSNVSNTSIDIENSKWFQDIVLKTIKESKAYDNLKCEVEKLQKEVYSMQSDINKNNNNNSDICDGDLDLKFSRNEDNLNIDLNNINTIFDSKNSINNSSNSANTNSLAQELKEANSPSITSMDVNFDNEVSSNGSLINKNTVTETMPPRSVHILMGKTFSSYNNIDKKIDYYKNTVIGSRMDGCISENYDRRVTGLKSNFNDEFNKLNNSIDCENNYYSFNNSYSNIYIDNDHITNQRLMRNSSDMFLGGQKQPQIQIPESSNNIKYTCFHNLNTNSSNVFHKRISNNSGNLYSNNNYLHSQLNYLNNNNRSIPFPGYAPNSNRFLSGLRLNNQFCVNEYIPGTSENGNNNGLPFRIKVTQKFRRTRNTSVPPKYIYNSGVGNETMFNCDDNHRINSNFVQDNVPEGYISFKTSITSPMNNQCEYLSPNSPYSFSSFGSGICPCDKTTNYCSIKMKSGSNIATNTDFKPRYNSFCNSASKNQFKGSVGLLRFK
ncbi:hypothetical protein FG386_002718 [Cryptosporidium ryanae]|uniref:uncharacterized protein n=1 Tax=Cryptosporidium ryanae TaxID=515981 RepID=UPI00351AA5D9|nr:hypothetical protein FG386_002718 [Cryptosporidium ryanae]